MAKILRINDIRTLSLKNDKVEVDECFIKESFKGFILKVLHL